ncbi:hypothetical protein [Sulfitobacter pacificus]|uniref:hypothetical protein n=1 Tax=Sulfitobacter pacificus TaxID=1499314 RepID=UPI00310913E8
MKWFAEIKTATSSHWMPCLYREKPEIDKFMRVKMTGARVRKQPVEIAPKDHGKRIFELQGIYGGDAHEPA